ncbi:MAG: PAS domain S-box protein [Desulfuromonadaceae bacterium]|nr:PAS domain S-box protein [Desulfuromonadaceae bacterium]
MNKAGQIVASRKYGIGLTIVWTCILAAILTFIIDEYHKDTIKEVTREAKDYHDLNLRYRKWGARAGGVYVSTDKVSPNPHLAVPDRDVTTGSGKSLTLVNPAYMTRMVFDIIRRESKLPIINRLVSLKPLNPENIPNAWESETLKVFENKAVGERFQLLSIGDQPYFQFMAAFITEESCLKCHAHQGYTIGDVRGGMSIAIPMSGYLALEAERKNSLFAGFALLWCMGVAGITVSSTRRHQQEMTLREYTVKLESEVTERQRIQGELEEKAIRLEKEISERRITQEQLEEQAILLEEENNERQLAVSALQKAEQFLHTIIDSEPECVKLVDADCNLLLMNWAGLEMIGADSFEQVKGICILPLVCEKYRGSFEDLTRKAFQGLSGNVEFEIVGLKGRRVWLHTTAVPFRDEHGTVVAALGITRNVTELKHSVEALRASEERFKGIAESLADWIWEMDTAGRFMFSSESSLRLLGYTPDEIIRKTVYEFIDPLDVERVREVLKENSINKSSIKNLEHWKIARDGRRVCLLSNGVPILNAQGELIGYRGVDSDVTDQRMLERQASQQQKLESIGLLAGGIAHDFNNLLVPIFGYAEMINTRHASDNKTAGYSATILKAALQAKDLVGRLLSFSRKQTFKLEKLDLNEVITSFMMILKRTIRENIAIGLQLSTEPCRILADRTQIEQALLNLAVNAQDAIVGTGGITIETGHLYFDHEYCLHHPGTIPGRYVMISFLDTGSGIDEAALPYIFDPFFTTKPTGLGTGLGLSTVFGVVKQHEGRIDVNSRKGVGTTFTLFFPEKVEGEETPVETLVAKHSDKPVGTILVVEDNPLVLTMVHDILEGVGHHVITAGEPSQALDIIRSCGESIDLLVSDVVMPEMNGTELYERAIEQMPGLKVLFMSGYAGVVTTYNGNLGEEANFISKPFTVEAFLRKVSLLIADNSG